MRVCVTHANLGRPPHARPYCSEDWEFVLVEDASVQSDVLTVKFKSHKSDAKHTRVDICDLPRVDFDQAVARFLILSPQPEEYVFTDGHDQLITTPALAGAVYSKGFFLGTKESLFYAVNVHNLKLDRDRSNPLQSRRVKSCFFELWAKAITAAPKPMAKRLLEDLFFVAVEGKQTHKWAP